MAPAPSPRRRWVALAALGSLMLGGLIAGNGLVSCASSPSATPPIHTRPVTASEAARLARVRLADYQAGHAALDVTIGAGINEVHLTGWIDWRQPLIYLNSLGQRPGPADGLLQATPGVVAVRPGRYSPTASTASSPANSSPTLAAASSPTPPATSSPTPPAPPMTPTSPSTAIDPFPPPPVDAPPTGWQVRPIVPGSAIDTMITLLFTLRSSTIDDAAQIAAIGTRFVQTDEIGGVPVDVIDGAAIPPTKPSIAPGMDGPTAATPTPSPSGPAFAAQGGQVRYWVDADSHLLRAEALVDPTTTLRIDFDRTDPIVPQAIELLGGRPNRPTKLTAKQLTQLSQMRAHNYLAGGGMITIAMPLATDELLSAVGWIDWRDRTLYVTVRNNKGTGPDATLRADTDGVTMRGSIDGSDDANSPAGQASPGTSPTPRAPLAVPSLHPGKDGWHRDSWASREDAYGETDLDAILNELLALSAPVIDSPAALKPVASRLRSDTVGGVPVTVYEIRKPSEGGIKPGLGRLRYWVAASGQLLRLELRTRNGAYGYVTIDPGPTPALPDPIPAKPAA